VKHSLKPDGLTLGSIRSDEFAPSRVFRARMGFGGDKAWRELLAKGFPVIRCGKQAFVDFGAAINWFRSLAAEDDANTLNTGPCLSLSGTRRSFGVPHRPLPPQPSQSPIEEARS
jgi:hypothetical protein